MCMICVHEIICKVSDSLKYKCENPNCWCNKKHKSKENDMTTMIAAAAILYEGEIFSVPKPGRHHDIFREIQRKLRIKEIGQHEQGFLTANGKFVTRELAATIAIESKQIKALKWPPKLFSEDLW